MLEASDKVITDKVITDFLGYPMFYVSPKVIEDSPTYTLEQILLLQNVPFLTEEASTPSIGNRPFHNGRYEELIQYGHLYSKIFKCVLLEPAPSHITILFRQFMDIMKDDGSMAVANLQAVMLLLSIYSQETKVKLTYKTNNKGVTPYGL